MKSSAVCVISALLVLAAVQGPLPSDAAKLVAIKADVENPIPQVVSLLTQLKVRIEADGQLEQQSYDKYACWLEDTMARKAKDIAEGKEQITELGAQIVKLKAEISVHNVEIQQAEKDMAANVESRREAENVRTKENKGYNEERMESEQCTGALEAAVKVLSGAGTKKGFLQNFQEAQLLSVVGGVRAILGKPEAAKSVSSSDLDVVRRFVEKPEDFAAGASGVSAAQVGNNPFGDYAPQSTQIQGILKGMHDTFVGDLEKSNSAEADAQKAFEALMETKVAEFQTLKETHEQHQLDEAEKSKDLAEAQGLLDDTKEQLKTDEEYFAVAKAAGSQKAEEWSERTRLRTEEILGIEKCIAFLDSPESRATFQSAHTTFLQLSSVHEDRTSAAYSALKGLAVKFKNVRLASIALQVKQGGHFDKVMASIDAMVALLRKEEQADIEHRDRCQNSENKNGNDMEDLQHDISKAGAKIGTLEEQITELQRELLRISQDIEATEDKRQELLRLRNEEQSAFEQAMQDDTNAVALLESAIEAMQAFYKRNGLPPALVQQPGNYTFDTDKAPETVWEGGDYGGRKSESQGLVAILEMVKEDLVKEMQTARYDDTQAQDRYKEEDGALGNTLDSQHQVQLAKEQQLGDAQGEKVDTEEQKNAKEADHTAETHLKAAIYRDCAWVGTNFDTRREKRKAEMAGLQEAKSYLAGVESGEAIAP